MAQKKLFDSYDALSGTKQDFYSDDVTGEYHTELSADLQSLEDYAHDMRSVEGHKGNRFKGDRYHPIGVLPAWIMWQYPQLNYANKEGAKFARKLFETEFPSLKTTNAKLC